MLLSHDNLVNHIKTNFSLVQFHKYSLSELEEMMPWEKAAYVDMLSEHVARENEKARDLKRERDAITRRYG